MPTRAPRHQPPRLAAPKRASTSQRGYDRRWQRLSRMFRKRHPLCADPFGLHAQHHETVAGEQVDHIIPRSAGGTDDWSNLQNLCAPCHSRKTAMLDGGFGNAREQRHATHRTDATNRMHVTNAMDATDGMHGTHVTQRMERAS